MDLIGLPKLFAEAGLTRADTSGPSRFPYLDVLGLPFVQINGADERDMHAQIPVNATAFNTNEGTEGGGGPARACVRGKK